MKKSFVALSLASIISACGLAPVVEATPRGGCKINLKQLYSAANGGATEVNECNFLEMTDGTILFFNPSIRKDLLSVMANHTDVFKANVLIFSPSARTSKIAVLTVRKSANTLLFDAYKVKDSEIDRTMLSPDWASVFSFCKTLYKNTDPRNRKFLDPDGVSFSGIARLPNGQFLITGGMTNGPYRDQASWAIQSAATVYDSSSNTVVKSFKLCQDRAHHLSLLLPDGKVLLVDPRGRVTSVEIVDPEAGTSRLLACQLSYRFRATACLDGLGNCLVLGGDDSKTESTGLVERIDINNETINKIGDLEIPRRFGGIRLNAITLPDHTILISGGSTAVRWHTIHDFNRDDAEIIVLDK